MINQFMQFFNSKNVVSVFCDRNNPDKHLTGFIERYSESELRIKHVSADGWYDGYILIHVDDVYRIDTDGQYEKKIQKLYSYKKQIHPELPASSNLRDSLLDYCQTQKLVISLELVDCILSGLLLYYDNSIIQLKVIDDNGRFDGESVVDINEVISFAVDTSTEQNILILSLSGN